jgi:aspartate/methionine/tyrosine aminotransferase
MRNILYHLGDPFRSELELISLNSVSKGLLGECGLRGGYMETANLDSFVSDMLYKLKSIELCLI